MLSVRGLKYRFTGLRESHGNNITAAAAVVSEGATITPSNFVIISAFIFSFILFILLTLSQWLEVWLVGRCAGSADAAPHYNVLLHARGPTGVKAFCVSTWTQHFTVHLSFITSSFPNHLINIIRLTRKCTMNSRDKKERRQKDAVSLRAAALAQRHQNERGCWCELTWATTEQCEIILAGLERTKLWGNIDEGLTWCSSRDLRMCG